jgi:hypothetical protein
MNFITKTFLGEKSKFKEIYSPQERWEKHLKIINK